MKYQIKGIANGGGVLMEASMEGEFSDLIEIQTQKADYPLCAFNQIFLKPKENCVYIDQERIELKDKQVEYQKNKIAYGYSYVPYEEVIKVYIKIME